MSEYKTCDDVLGKCTCVSHPYSDCANCSCGYRVDELLAERDALKAELEKLKFEAENMATTIQGAIEEHNALRAKLDKATAGLEKFLRQNRDCPLCAMFESAQVILTELKA